MRPRRDEQNATPGPGLRHARSLGLAALLALAASGCAVPRAATLPGDVALGGSPTLEEIFLIPGIQGRPPQIDRVSADGQWLLLRWNPMEIGEQGQRKIAQRGALRLQSALEPESSGFQGRPLSELLPPRPAKPAPVKDAVEAPSAPQEPAARDAESPLISRWSHRGARLAIARGNQIFVLDPPLSPRGQWRASLLYEDPTSEGEQLGDVESLEFDARDAELRVVASKELWTFPLTRDESHVWPIPLSGAWCRTREVEAPAGELQWSDDLRIAFSSKPPAAWITPPPPPDAPADAKPPDKVPAQVVNLESGQRVTLEGLAEIRWLDNASLSPDGRFVFAEDIDKSAEPPPTLVPDYLTPRVSTREARRELADDLPSPRKLWMWNAETGARTAIALPGEDVYWLRNLGWAPRPDGSGPACYAFARTSRDFHTLETWCWSEGNLRLLLTDHDERWIGGPTEGARWSRDGKAIVFGSESLASSDRPGHNQLFALDAASGECRQLTHVSGEVASYALQDDGGIVYAFSEAEHPERRKLAWISPSGSTNVLASPEGFVSNLSPSAITGGVLFRHESLGEPGEIWSIAQQSGAVARELTRTTPAGFSRIDWIRPVLFEVEGERGARVMSHVYLPRSTRLEHPDRPRAAIVFIHGAGYLQNVTDSMTEYEVNLMFHSRLARMGYVVVDVDYRGSEGYGEDFRTAVQGHLGGLELDDIHRTIDALAARGVIDAKRVGCYGGSYGGFLTLMALFTAPERWACGAALRSVTDWRTYHPAYTQPRLGRPSTDPEAYALSSPIDHTAGLVDPLLILHGMVDSNVFAQDSIRLIEKLIDEGKDFETMLYPSQGHGFQDGRHWVDEYKRIERFLTLHLGAP